MKLTHRPIHERVRLLEEQYAALYFDDTLVYGKDKEIERLEEANMRLKAKVEALEHALGFVTKRN